jgi:hypothetical protein
MSYIFKIAPSVTSLLNNTSNDVTEDNTVCFNWLQGENSRLIMKGIVPSTTTFTNFFDSQVEDKIISFQFIDMNIIELLNVSEKTNYIHVNLCLKNENRHLQLIHDHILYDHESTDIIPNQVISEIAPSNSFNWYLYPVTVRSIMNEINYPQFHELSTISIQSVTNFDEEVVRTSSDITAVNVLIEKYSKVVRVYTYCSIGYTVGIIFMIVLIMIVVYGT